MFESRLNSKEKAIHILKQQVSYLIRSTLLISQVVEASQLLSVLCIIQQLLIYVTSVMLVIIKCVIIFHLALSLMGELTF